MKDIRTLFLDDDNLFLGLSENVEELHDASTQLIQKIMFLLKQEANSNFFHSEGFSLNSILRGKISSEDDTKVKITLLVKKLEQTIIADQEQYPTDPSAALEKITIADITLDKQTWRIGLIVFDKAGGKTFVGVNV